jgi:mRNA-degrading endonuclease toxin of MazEF toxin-antitoxin module
MVDQPSNGHRSSLIEQGDIYSLAPNGTKVLVISATAFNALTHTPIVVTISDQLDRRMAGFSVHLGAAGMSGAARCDRIYSVRLNPPGASKLGKAPKSIVTEVVHRVIAILAGE